MKARLSFVFLLCSLLAAAGVPLRGPGEPGLVLLGRSGFETGRAAGWKPNDPSHWRVVKKDREMVYELTAAGKQGRVRAPTSWSLWNDFDVTSFEFSGRLRCSADPSNTKRDMCLFFHFQDPTHFYYVHLAASSDDVHNIIALVNGADRVKINAEPAGASRAGLTNTAWHEFKVTYDAPSGRIEAYLDDMSKPILTAHDKTLGSGLVGVGSFDDTGCFAGLELRGLIK